MMIVIRASSTFPSTRLEVYQLRRILMDTWKYTHRSSGLVSWERMEDHPSDEAEYEQDKAQHSK